MPIKLLKEANIQKYHGNKSRANRTEIDKLTFHWDHKASRLHHASRDTHAYYNKKRSLNEYFGLLNELKPNVRELRRTRMFKEIFTLN